MKAQTRKPSPKARLHPRRIIAPAGSAVIVALALFSGEPTSATTQAPGLSNLQDHQNWTSFTRPDLPGHTWATNASEYPNTVLSIHLAADSGCRPELAMLINKADLGNQPWVTAFKRIEVGIDAGKPAHLIGLGLYQPARDGNKGSLLIDTKTGTSSPGQLIERFDSGRQLQLHIDARDQSMGTLSATFSLAGASEAIERAQAQCLAIRDSAISLSSLNL